MKNIVNTLLNPIAFAIFVALCASCGQKYESQTITVINPADFDRVDEIVEVEVALNPNFDHALLDKDGNNIEYQLIYPDGCMILFPATVAAGDSAIYSFVPRKSELIIDTVIDESQYYNVAYTVRPDCQDDFAWENEHSGYRLYGPSFKRGGGKVHGYDIWCKRTPDRLVKRFYDLDHGPEHISYHVDHGEGFDGYTVGPTLGAGANALLLGDEICYPTAYDNYVVTANGPLRLEVMFTVDSIPYGTEADGITPRYITEYRTVSLDRNAHFNKVSTYYGDIDSPTSIVAGIVVHADNPDGYTLMDDVDAITVTDLSDNVAADNGEIYVAVIVPGADTLRYEAFDQIKANAVGQVLAQTTYTGQDRPFTYYWGSGWSKGSVPDSAAWANVVIEAKKRIDCPLVVKNSYFE